MKRINQYKKLFKVEGSIDLKELKKTYRGLVKEWHPDKFQEEDKKEEASLKSLEIIDGYHFLVSISPEKERSKFRRLRYYTFRISSSRFSPQKHVVIGYLYKWKYL